MASNFKVYVDSEGNEITVLPGRTLDAAGFMSRDTQGAFAVVAFMATLEEQGLATLH